MLSELKLEVTTDLATDFGLAWYGRAIPEPGSGMVALLFAGAMLARRHRCNRKMGPAAPRAITMAGKLA